MRPALPTWYRRTVNACGSGVSLEEIRERERARLGNEKGVGEKRKRVLKCRTPNAERGTWNAERQGPLLLLGFALG
jgi:hypothetical protein